MASEKKTTGEKAAIVGAGFYGCHTALELAKQGHEVILLEQDETICSRLSGKFGARSHVGAHYPESEKTREGCYKGFPELLESYPDLMIELESSIYAVGKKDAMGLKPKVGLEEFRKVCIESNQCHKDPANFCQEIAPEDMLKYGLNKDELEGAFKVVEPCIAGGEKLREFFRKKLNEAGVKVVCNFEAMDMAEDSKSGKVILKGRSITRNSDGTVVRGEPTEQLYDHVINATAFQALLPKKALPFDMKVLYQPCGAYFFADSETSMYDEPSARIVMTGLFPAVKPEGGRYEGPRGTTKNGQPCAVYMVFHAAWTNMKPCSTVQEAYDYLKKTATKDYEAQVRLECEKELNRFFPNFTSRYRYCGMLDRLISTKVETNKEFREGFVFAEGDNTKIIHLFPGKISNVFEVAREAALLIAGGSKVFTRAGYTMVRGGALHLASSEVMDPPREEDRQNTSKVDPVALLRAMAAGLTVGVTEPEPKNKSGAGDTASTTVTDVTTPGVVYSSLRQLVNRGGSIYSASSTSPTVVAQSSPTWRRASSPSPCISAVI